MKKHTVRIRMGAAAWTIEVPGLTIDMRKLDKDAQRQAIFQVVKYVRIAKEQTAA
jgi:hypothetical protein